MSPPARNPRTGSPMSEVVAVAAAMEPELLQMKATAAWPQLLQAIAQHGKNARQLLAVHTSTCCQPEKAVALVPSLGEAGLQQAHQVPGSRAWRVS